MSASSSRNQTIVIQTSLLSTLNGKAHETAEVAVSSRPCYPRMGLRLYVKKNELNPVLVGRKRTSARSSGRNESQVLELDL